MQDAKLSVIIPMFNEPEKLVLSLLEWMALNKDKPVEWIFALATDDFSDAAKLIRNNPNLRYVDSSRGRSRQMNTAARFANGDFLLFLHADTRLSGNWYQQLAALIEDNSIVWGAFNPAIQGKGCLLRLAEHWGRWRSLNLGIPYGDQSIFIANSLFTETGCFDEDIDFMEELEMSRRLVKKGLKPVILPGRAITSARRWTEHGQITTSLKNALAFTAFYLGVPRHLIKRFYLQK